MKLCVGLDGGVTSLKLIALCYSGWLRGLSEHSLPQQFLRLTLPASVTRHLVEGESYTNKKTATPGHRWAGHTRSAVCRGS